MHLNYIGNAETAFLEFISFHVWKTHEWIFTDDSKSTQGRVGAGVLFYKTKVELTVRLQDSSTVLDAELYAISTAILFPSLTYSGMSFFSIAKVPWSS